MEKAIVKLVSYGLDFLSAQPIAAFIESYTASAQAEAFDRYISSIERWDND